MTATLEQRLRMALEAPLTTSEGVDMSPASITHRLMELAEMSSLCLELGTLGRGVSSRFSPDDG